MGAKNRMLQLLFEAVARGFGNESIVMRGIKKLYPRFGLLPSDIIFGTFPKSGTTWVRFIFANIVSLAELGGREVDYSFLNGPLHAGYDTNGYPKIKYSVIPRVVSTHMEYDKRRFGMHKKLYLYRNPGDTMVSYYEYRSALRGAKKYSGSFKEFIRNDRFGIPAWCRHVSSWISQADVVITYEELKQNTFGCLKKIIDLLEMGDVKEIILREAIQRSDFSRIREIESKSGPGEKAKRHLEAGTRFARKGTIGQWREYFDSEDLNYLVNQVDRYGLGFVLPLPSGIRAEM